MAREGIKPEAVTLAPDRSSTTSRTSSPSGAPVAPPITEPRRHVPPPAWIMWRPSSTTSTRWPAGAGPPNQAPPRRMARSPSAGASPSPVVKAPPEGTR